MSKKIYSYTFIACKDGQVIKAEGGGPIANREDLNNLCYSIPEKLAEVFFIGADSAELSLDLV